MRTLKWPARLSFILAAADLIWCVGIGIWIWVTPTRYIGVRVNPGQPDVQMEGYRSFSDVSDWGAAPLIVPAILAALATWAAWTGRKIVLALATVLFIGYTYITGFSIGSAYHPAAGILVLATVIAFAVNSSHSG
jgi:hypothetical protein